jgi:hypothetical protein
MGTKKKMVLLVAGFVVVVFVALAAYGVVKVFVNHADTDPAIFSANKQETMTAQPGEWNVQSFKDDLGNDSGERYLVTSAAGSFRDAKTSGSLLTANVLVTRMPGATAPAEQLVEEAQGLASGSNDDDRIELTGTHLCFDLYEYGETPVVAGEGQPQAELTIDGRVQGSEVPLVQTGNRFYFGGQSEVSDRSDASVISALLAGKTVEVSIETGGEQGATYDFSIIGGGFAKAYNQLLS